MSDNRVESGNEEDCINPENDSCDDCNENTKCKTRKYPHSTKEEQEKISNKLEGKIWLDEIQETFK